MGEAIATGTIMVGLQLKKYERTDFAHRAERGKDWGNCCNVNIYHSLPSEPVGKVATGCLHSRGNFVLSHYRERTSDHNYRGSMDIAGSHGDNHK